MLKQLTQFVIIIRFNDLYPNLTFFFAQKPIKNNNHTRGINYPIIPLNNNTTTMSFSALQYIFQLTKADTNRSNSFARDIKLHTELYNCFYFITGIERDIILPCFIDKRTSSGDHACCLLHCWKSCFQGSILHLLDGTMA